MSDMITLKREDLEESVGTALLLNPSVFPAVAHDRVTRSIVEGLEEKADPELVGDEIGAPTVTLPVTVWPNDSKICVASDESSEMVETVEDAAEWVENALDWELNREQRERGRQERGEFTLKRLREMDEHHGEEENFEIWVYLSSGDGWSFETPKGAIEFLHEQYDQVGLVCIYGEIFEFASTAHAVSKLSSIRLFA